MKKTGRALALILCLLMGLLTVFGCQKNKDDNQGENESEAFNYFTADLSQYIDIPETMYKDLHVSVNLDRVTDAEVNDAIGNVLYANRSETGVGKNTGTVGYGDMVKVWYRGYTEDEFGNQTDLYGTTNFANSSPTEISVGAGGYVSGFESALVGAAYQLGIKEGLNKRAAGDTIQEGDTVYVLWSGTKQMEDKTYKGLSNQMIRFVYNEENRSAVESAYGLPASYKDSMISFFDLVGSVKVGDYYDGDATFLVETETAGETLTVWYYDLQVFAVTTNECEANKLAVADAYFPINYGDERFNGKTVKFDFYIDATYDYFKDYTVPELDDAFIHDTLGIGEEDLSVYEGANTVSRYRNMVKAKLEEAQDLQTATFNALWKLWNDLVTVKEYPAGEIDLFVAEYQTDLEEAFASAAENAGLSVEEYATYYYSLEEFAHKYYEAMEDDDTVASYVRKQAEDAAKEKLILYALARITNNVPSEEAWLSAYEDLVDNYLAYYLSDTSEENEYRRDNFATEEAYEEAKAELRAKIITYYGESFLRESGFYQYVMEALAKNVVETTYLGRND